MSKLNKILSAGVLGISVALGACANEPKTEAEIKEERAKIKQSWRQWANMEAGDIIHIRDSRVGLCFALAKGREGRKGLANIPCKKTDSVKDKYEHRTDYAWMIHYLRDARTGICYATIPYTGPLADVPCEKVESVLDNPSN